MNESWMDIIKYIWIYDGYIKYICTKFLKNKNLTFNKEDG